MSSASHGLEYLRRIGVKRTILPSNSEPSPRGQQMIILSNLLPQKF